ncbi:TatD family hydrolase [Sulfodiicoccus acidiphilus]|uniref:TatD family hydrolase n=1 Tax=Sulfodiicoccus acidiphilus TaxID=1670455 RepID=A0A348B6K0_9CREN|nr:TatD family hydrolase [Sulfodiicoccus acidiphilus]BBD73802.1 TatD family hydrolase [Sulfodiicoccus acidiphilus]GGU03624.1 TatD family hydrolase [Sulfodiicoccus acidiphilus]
MLYDVHAHLETPEFEKDRDEVLSRCSVVVVNAGVDLKSNLAALELASMYWNVLPAVGFHPEFVAEKMNELEDSLSLVSKVTVISEVGLDYFWVKEPESRKAQREVFSKFLELGERQGKPLVIHVRGGMNEALDLLGSHEVRFALHAFEGNARDALRAVDLGGFISFPPVLVRDRNRQEVLKKLPLSSVLTETDSPFLGPTRSVRNEPCNVALTLQKISSLVGSKLEDVEEVVSKNTLSLIPQLKELRPR